MKPRPSATEACMSGIGLDHRDEHVRPTTGPDFMVMMGSEETHERMHGTCRRIHETLQRQGRKLADLSRGEFGAMVREMDES